MKKITLDDLRLVYTAKHSEGAGDDAIVADILEMLYADFPSQGTLDAEDGWRRVYSASTWYAADMLTALGLAEHKTDGPDRVNNMYRLKDTDE